MISRQVASPAARPKMLMKENALFRVKISESDFEIILYHDINF